MAEKTRAALDVILPEWADGIIGLSSLGKDSPLPPTAYVSAGRFGPAFESALLKCLPTSSVNHTDPSIMASFVDYAPSVVADLSASMYAAALPLSRKL
jgi:hypothetical protein